MPFIFIPSLFAAGQKLPFWRFAIRFWGYSGSEKVTGIATWEKKNIAALQKERLLKARTNLERQAGICGARI